MRRVMTIVAAAVLAFSLPVAASALETPEAAIQEYLAGVAQADVARVLEASAVDEMTEGYQLGQMVDFLGQFHPGAEGPVHDPFFADIQHAQATARLLAQTRMLAYTLLAPETLTEVVFARNPILGVDAAWAMDLMAELDTARLSGLEVMDIAVPRPGLYYSDVTSEGYARRAERVSADEGVERVALIDFEGDLYDVGFMLLRYGDEWKVANQMSSLAANLVWGAPHPTTIKGWDKLTSE